MKQAPLRISVAIQAMTVETRGRVAARLLALFKTAPIIAALGQERAAKLEALLISGGGLNLGVVSTGVREAIAEARETKLRRFSLWNIVDAIGNVCDCEPGGSPYFTDEMRRKSLLWAAEGLDEIEKDVADAIHAEAASAEPMAA